MIKYETVLKSFRVSRCKLSKKIFLGKKSSNVCLIHKISQAVDSIKICLCHFDRQSHQISSSLAFPLLVTQKEHETVVALLCQRPINNLGNTKERASAFYIIHLYFIIGIVILLTINAVLSVRLLQRHKVTHSP